MMTATDVMTLARSLGVTIAKDGDKLRLKGVPPGPAGEALVDLVKRMKADLLDRLAPPACLIRVWFCECGAEIRADLSTCPSIWCGASRRGPVFSYEVIP